ncbi:hypothetical protein H4683_003532 [Filibacter limicola]|uniref:DNA-binding protein n=1 Tax=Sporosarcina limicola TaxID=34101 RepID=A0A927MP29_9BACL|nr:GldG family protein [Sporosarcina limicola]MBE1556407.1 hypothetical protein [Sporosarcina limicola]
MRNIKLLFVLLATVISFSFTHVNVSLAEGPNDSAPIYHPSNPNGKKVLFDNSHGQTAGQSDWVIDGAFSDFAEALVAEGYSVEEFRSHSPLTSADLIGYDVFVIPEAQIPFKATEQNVIASFAEQGGGVFFIADHYNADRNLNRWDSNEIMNGWRRGAYNNPTLGMSTTEALALTGVVSSNWLSNEFGVQFRYNALDNTVANQIVSLNESFGITENVNKVSIHAGSTLAITNPEVAKGIVYLPTGLTAVANKWSNSVDQGVYAGGGIDEGPFVAISKKLDGKAAFIGDSSPVEDATPKYLNEETGSKKRTYDGFTADFNGELLVNIINWLATEENYDKFTETSITLDSVTPLLSMELPQNSTEILGEPWRTPNAGYLWYDQSTFAAGSYGSTVSPPATFMYTLQTPPVLDHSGNPFTVTLKVENLQPNQSISGLKMQVYLDGGTAISQIQNSNGSWPSSYGYQDIGALTADNNGVAQKTITMSLNPSVTATSASIRLKDSNGNNLITKAVVLGEVVAEPEEAMQIVENGQYQISLPQALPSLGEAFPVKVQIGGLAAGATVMNAQIQIYLAGGTSVSQIQNADKSWPSSYGYFNIGTLTADASGVASKQVMMRLNPAITASQANIRLRLGSGNNVLTASIQLR